jgi:hypothetical protein
MIKHPKEEDNQFEISVIQDTPEKSPSILKSSRWYRKRRSKQTITVQRNCIDDDCADEGPTRSDSANTSGRNITRKNQRKESSPTIAKKSTILRNNQMVESQKTRNMTTKRSKTKTDLKKEKFSEKMNLMPNYEDLNQVKKEPLMTEKLENQDRNGIKKNRNRVSLHPKSVVNYEDSFDRLSDGEKKKNKGVGRRSYKFQGPAVRTKVGRAALPGVDCPECREYYDNENLTESQYRELLDRCSKHRVQYVPTARRSPKAPWTLDMDDEVEAEKTQVRTPLRRRSDYKKKDWSKGRKVK